MALSFTAPTLYVILTLMTLVVIWLWTRKKAAFPKNIPPYPSRPWPIFGHFFMLGGRLREKLARWRQHTGDIFSLNVAGQLHILVHDYSFIKEIWVKNADRIVNTQPTIASELLHEENKGIGAARDENWKEQRSTSVSILRQFGMGKTIMADRILEEAHHLLKTLEGFQGEPHDVRILLNISVSNVICSVIVGKRFDYQDPAFVKLMFQLGELIKYIRAVNIITPAKFLYYLPGDIFHIKRWVKNSTEVREEFGNYYVQKFLGSYKDNDDPDNFITAYIRAMRKAQHNGGTSNLDESNLSVIVRTLFLAGTETTSTTTLWGLLYMLHYPEVQEKVYQEILTHVGKDRLPTMSDKSKLTYLNATIMEIQRKASIAVSGLLREVDKTFEVRGFTFPKGSILWPVLGSVLHDKKIWGDPENFRPERFIDENGALINKEELIPFGIGRRACMGESLARMELYLFLAALFQKFRFEPEFKSELPTLREASGGSIVPEPYKIKFIERQ